MKQSLEKKLYRRFKFFKTWRPLKGKWVREKDGTLGAACGDGWYKLIWNLCEHLELEIKKMSKRAQADFYVNDIKEKFGGLRFYISHGTDFMHQMCSIVDGMSQHICETCGKPGKAETVHGWVITACPKHLNEYKRKQGIPTEELYE